MRPPPRDTPEFLERYERYRGDRDQLLMLADESARKFRTYGPVGLCRFLAETAPDHTAAANLVALAEWHRYGLQSVELGHKLAAALMATSATGALDHAHLPWPAFEIRVPAGLLESSHGDIYSCIVHGRPDWVPEAVAAGAMRVPPKGDAGAMVMYYDARTIGHVGVANIAEIARFEPREFHMGLMREVLRAEYDQSKEDRVKQLLMRLVTGVILLVTEARADKPHAYPQHPLRPPKHGLSRPNTHRVTRSVTIDVTQNIRDFVRGVGRDSPHVTTLVRGHWRQQAYGPRHTLRRPQWIEPFWRGEGPLQVRPTRLDDPR